MRAYGIKRTISLLLAAVLLLGNAPVSAFAAEENIHAAEEIVMPEETAAETTEAAEETSASAEETIAPTQSETVPEETAAPTKPAVETVPVETEVLVESEEEICAEEAVNATITDYSNYSFQLYSADAGGAKGPIYLDSYYMNYQWWSQLTYSNNVNDKFETRVRFEKDISGDQYRLYIYAVRAFEDQLYVQKYYLMSATVPT